VKATKHKWKIPLMDSKNMIKLLRHSFWINCKDSR